MSSPENPNPNNDSTEFVRLHDGMSALIERKWQQDVETFREALARKLDPLIGADAKGWAHFEYLHTDPVSSEMLTKEAMLIRLLPHDIKSSRQQCPPMIKIITNETFMSNNTTNCLSEDILIDDDSDAMYYVDAIILEGPGSEESQAISYAQAFHIPADDKAMFVNFELVPPRLDISEGNSEQPLLPFGMYDSRVDGEYTLQRAWAVLGEVWEEYPKHIGN